MLKWKQIRAEWHARPYVIDSIKIMRAGIYTGETRYSVWKVEKGSDGVSRRIDVYVGADSVGEAMVLAEDHQGSKGRFAKRAVKGAAA